MKGTLLSMTTGCLDVMLSPLAQTQPSPLRSMSGNPFPSGASKKPDSVVGGHPATGSAGALSSAKIVSSPVPGSTLVTSQVRPSPFRSASGTPPLVSAKPGSQALSAWAVLGTVRNAAARRNATRTTTPLFIFLPRRFHRTIRGRSNKSVTWQAPSRAAEGMPDCTTNVLPAAFQQGVLERDAGQRCETSNSDK